MNPETILLEDYKQKITYLMNHMTRMWTRFNFFVTIESALIGGKFLVASNIPSRELAVAGMLLSAFWYVMGAQDRYLFKVYRWQVKMTAGRIASNLKAPAGTDQAAMDLLETAQQSMSEYVGRLDETLLARFEDEETRRQAKDNSFARLLEKISSWRSRHFSITHLAAFYPLIVFGLWLFVFAISKPLP